MHELEVINPVENKNWNELLLATSGHSFFHTSNWADVLQKTYKYTPTFFVSYGENKITNLLPVMEVKSFLTGKRGVSLPFTDFCEPLVVEGQQFRIMLDKAVSFGKKRNWKYLGIRGGESYLSAEQPADIFYCHKLDLTLGQKQLFLNLRDSTKRNIKKAQKEKVSISITTSWQAMKAFCSLNTLTRREHGLPPQPFNFFRNLHDLVIKKDLGFIVTASANNIVIAANVYFTFGNEVTYKYGASDKQFHRLRANNLVMWEAIRWSVNNGFKELSFGRTEPENAGLRQYKRGWGGREYLRRYYKYDLQKDKLVNDTSGISPLFENIFHRLPLHSLNILGRLFYRHMG